MASAIKPERGLAFRLAPLVRPSAYRLHVHVDPERSKIFKGQVEVDVRVAEPVAEVVLHAADLQLLDARVSSPAADTFVPAQARLRTSSETLHVRRRGGFSAGQYTLKLGFRGRLRTDLRGLYGTIVGDARYAFTQLEAADARRFFPCFDEPSFKACFTVSVTTAAHHTVIGNAPQSQVDDRGDGKKTVHFRTTPKLSTYLLALAVGPLQGSDIQTCGKVPVRVWHAHRPARLASFALATAVECLARLERYFAIPYPYEKLDLVAVPDFEIGAMENAGAVFFRETLLLLDERSASVSEQKRAAEVICHELAHMWFGNLVTMAFWDDLWLNEAFATWIAFAIVDELRPDWRMWNDFAHGRDSALELDALSNTHAIYTPVRTPDEATENFDLITYEKGAAVVRMLERYLGHGRFRKGVRSYIRAHREGNAVAADLWRHLERAAGKPGVARLVKSWVRQPGFPLLTLTRIRTASSDQLALTQTRFSSRGPGNPGRDKPRGDRDRGGTPRETWLIPLCARSVPEGTKGGGREVRAVVRRRRETIDLSKLRVGPHPLLGNAQQTGCYRVAYDGETLRALAARLPRLQASERLGLVTDGWAMVRAGYSTWSDYQPLLFAFHDEDDPDALGAVCASLGRVSKALPESFQPRLMRAIVDDFGHRLTKRSLSRRLDDDGSLVRAELFGLLGNVAQAPQVKAWAADLCQRYLRRTKALDGNLAAPVLSVAAIDGDLALFERYLAASLSAETPQERQRVRMALADFRDEEASTRLHELCLQSEIPTQDVARVLARQLANRSAGALTWAFIKRRWTAVSKRMTPMLISRLIAATTELGPQHQTDVLAFLRAHPIPTAQRTVRQTREQFQLERAFRRRLAAELRHANA